MYAMKLFGDKGSEIPRGLENDPICKALVRVGEKINRENYLKMAFLSDDSVEITDEMIDLILPDQLK